MQNVKAILRVLVQESLNLELWLERYEYLKCLGGYFVNFLGLWTFLDFVFILQGPDCEIFGLQVNF
jgi:hypothetical protein